MKKIYMLDYIRAISCILIMLYHYTTRFFDSYYNLGYENNHIGVWWGCYAVAVFFILSGFLTVYNLRDEQPKNFIIKRAVRLYPSYWIGIIFTTCVTLIFSIDKFIGIIPTLINFTMLQGFIPGMSNVDGVYWTLRYELQFYVIIAFIMVIKQTKKIDIICMIWILISIINNYLESVIGNGIVIKMLSFLFMTERAAPFIIGVAIAGIIKFKIKSVSCINLMLASVSMCGKNIIYIVPIIITTVLIFTSIKVNLKFKYDKPLVFLAGISYEVYLIHQVFGYRVFYICKEQLYINTYILIIPMMCISIGVAYLINRCAAKMTMLIKNSSIYNRITA